MSTSELQEFESVQSLRWRARKFLLENLEQVGPTAKTLRNELTDEQELAGVARDREVQGLLFAAGLAGICVPREYGGQGLTHEHNQAFKEELAGYEFPSRMQSPTFSPCLAVLLDFATEEQKLRHIPAILKGEEIWMQFLSEPSGGSDVAGALMTATRDGEEWILNGSKVWTTGAWWSDWGLCLVRTNWDVPKHRGLTVFMLALRTPGIEVHRIEMLNGNSEFCQEFMTDVRVPDGDRIGDIDQGWTVGTRWMFHERMLYNSPYVTIPADSNIGVTGAMSMSALAREAGRSDDAIARDLIGEARTLSVVRHELEQRLGVGIRSGAMSDQASAIGRLFGGLASVRTTTIAFELSGAFGGAWVGEDGDVADCGTDFLMRQASCIGGGTTEMARNVISERVLGMPRESSYDRDTPFRDVPRSRGAR